MVKNIVSKSEFARMAGVSAASITKACSGILKPAMVGKRLDAGHDAAVKYLNSKCAQPSAPGLDVLYEKAVEYCVGVNSYSITGLQKHFKIGYERARKIIEVMKTTGLVPEKKQQEEPLPDLPSAPAPPKQTPAPRGHAAANEKKKQSDPENMIYEIPEDIRAFSDMTLLELVNRFGTDLRFVDWLKATKHIEDINEKRLKNAKTKGELVSRYLVKIGIIDPIDAAHIKLLTDGSKTIARRVVAMHDAGRPLEDVEKFVADQITSFIRPIKSKVERALKNA